MVVALYFRVHSVIFALIVVKNGSIFCKFFRFARQNGVFERNFCGGCTVLGKFGIFVKNQPLV